MRLTVFGAPSIVVNPDTFFFVRSTPDTFRTSFRIRNNGTDTLRYTITEGLSSASDEEENAASIARSMKQQPHQELTKGAHDPMPPQPTSPRGRGGPDAFGYTWIDSDEPGGPLFDWVDISTTGTPITTWTGTADDGYFTTPLPWAFPFYGTDQTSINIVTNGFANFGTTSTAFSNTGLPTTAAPNNALYPYWDDLDLQASGTVYYRHDAANGRFIIQWNNVPHYALGTPTEFDTLTFQIILRPSGDILYQYLRKATAESTATVGIENSVGTIALQTSFNRRYVKPNLAVLFTKDLLPWASVDRTDGTILVGDSTTISLRVHPAGLVAGTYRGRLIVAGNTPVIGRVRMQLNWSGETSTLAVMSPNGGERLAVGQTHNITWSHNLVDTLTIAYSTTGRSGPYTSISSGVPASLGTFNWTVPNTPSGVCFVRITRKSNGVPADTSDAAFSIEPRSPLWSLQTSGVSVILNWVKVVNTQIIWAGGANGVVIRTTNGGLTWTSVGGGAIGTADTYCGDALNADIAFTSTSPSAAFIYRTTNGGTTWTQVFTQTGGFIDGIQMQNATEGYALGDPSGGNWTFLKTTNGGASWSLSTPTIPAIGSEGGWSNSFQVLNCNIWFGTNAGRFYRSSDCGATWFTSTTPTANVYAFKFVTPGIGIAGGATGATSFSSNSGATWSTRSTAGTANISGIASAEPNWWASTGNSVYYSNDNGTTWIIPDRGYAGTQPLNHVSIIAAGSFEAGCAVGAAGTVVRYVRITEDVGTDTKTVPTEYALEQNYPNPFNPSTTIHFALPERTAVTLKVYNVLGQEVATLVDGEMPAAFHSVAWLGTNKSGNQVATGLYFYRLTAGNFVEMKKMILAK
jgi:photosystem II stability/assembly factor-like uncharacterized protein